MVANSLRVTLTPDGFYPRSLRWQGRGVRVLYIEETYTCGLERRYRLRTPEGRYELGLHTGTGVWQMRRVPTWFERLRLRVLAMPRYPAPLGRRRWRRAADARLEPDTLVTVPRPALAISFGR